MKEQIKPNYVYPAFVERIIDGDTIEATIDVGFNMFFKTKIRVLGVDTPELRSKDSEEKLEANKAKDWVREKLENKKVFVKTTKTDSFGRYLSEIFYEENDVQKNLTEELISEGLGDPFMTGFVQINPSL